MPKCLLLFGSVARGTETSESDVDLLAVGGDRIASSLKTNGVEVQNYSEFAFMALASEGNLFGAHLAMEARALFDPHRIFVSFRESFELKASYEQEKQHAFELARFLQFHQHKFSDTELVAKRFAWCVRTVLIATLAEKRKLVFSPEGLYKEFSFEWAHQLMSLRRDGADRIEFKSVLSFLEFFGEIKMPRSYEEYASTFSESSNEVAIATLRRLESAPTKMITSYS